MIRRSRFWRALPLAIVSGSVAQAQQIDLSHGGPLNVTAENGLEWRQNEQTVLAHGNARAVRDNVTVTADELLARYRKKAGGATPASAPAPPPVPSPPTQASAGDSAADPDTSGNEIYRVEAHGDVHIDTPTDHATGDDAIYDIDQAVLLMTGHDLRITTPSQVITARDSMEYYTQKHMAVGRGDATVVTSDGRRIAADVLVAYTAAGAAQPASQPTSQPAPAQPVKASATPAAPADPLAASGKLQKVEAFGHVAIRTATDFVTGDRGVYVEDTGIARLAGNVRITRGQNQLAGSEAEVNLRTGISRLLSGSHERVQGLVVPADADAQHAGGAQPAAKAAKPK